MIRSGDIVSTQHSFTGHTPPPGFPHYAVAIRWLREELYDYTGGQTPPHLDQYWLVKTLGQHEDGGWFAGVEYEALNPRLHPQGLALIGRSLQPRLL